MDFLKEVRSITAAQVICIHELYYANWICMQNFSVIKLFIKCFMTNKFSETDNIKLIGTC